MTTFPRRAQGAAAEPLQETSPPADECAVDREGAPQVGDRADPFRHIQFLNDERIVDGWLGREVVDQGGGFLAIDRPARRELEQLAGRGDRLAGVPSKLPAKLLRGEEIGTTWNRSGHRSRAGARRALNQCQAV
ncbi:MAG: hypothetical protein ABSF61_03905 [Anaerolineales bacterium]|jgi:hypothetical protein